MDIHDDVTVTLPYWKWQHFLGWALAKSVPGENETVDDVLVAVESGVKP